jgi:hypothetical protein
MGTHLEGGGNSPLGYASGEYAHPPGYKALRPGVAQAGHSMGSFDALGLGVSDPPVQLLVVLVCVLLLVVVGFVCCYWW